MTVSFLKSEHDQAIDVVAVLKDEDEADKLIEVLKMMRPLLPEED